MFFHIFSIRVAINRCSDQQTIFLFSDSGGYGPYQHGYGQGMYERKETRQKYQKKHQKQTNRKAISRAPKVTVGQKTTTLHFLLRKLPVLLISACIIHALMQEWETVWKKDIYCCLKGKCPFLFLHFCSLCFIFLSSFTVTVVSVFIIWLLCPFTVGQLGGGVGAKPPKPGKSFNTRQKITI